MAALIGTESNWILAQQPPEYQCRPKDTIIYAMDAGILVCATIAPIDEKKLRFFSEQIYSERSGKNYSNFKIFWYILDGPESEKDVTESGIVRFKNGKLTEIDVTPINKDN